MPEMSVIMPAYNAAPYLREAVDSILAQTFTDFELIVIDDCSTDETPDILSSYNDSRLRVLRNDKNMERSFSKNLGITEAKAELVAFLDADDYAMPERLAVQHAFMSDNPEVILSSCYSIIMDSNTITRPPSMHNEIFARLLLTNPIVQSGVVLRKKALSGLDFWFRDETIPSEDYDLWTRMACLFSGKLAIIPNPLIKYRLVNFTNEAYCSKQRKVAEFSFRTMLDAFALIPTSHEFRLHCLLSTDVFPNSPEHIQEAQLWLHKILDHNKQVKIFEQEALLKAVRHTWWHFCNRASRRFAQTAWYYLISDFSSKPWAIKYALRMFAKFIYFKIVRRQKF